MRILIISVGSTIGSEVNRNLAGHVLHSYLLKNLGSDLEVTHLEFFHQNLLCEIPEIIALKPDIVALSAYCWSSQSLIVLADALKQATNATIVMGGPDVQTDSEWLLNVGRSVDLFVRGEGEVSLLQIAKQKDEGAISPETIGSAIWRDDEGVLRYNAPAPRVSLEDVPSTIVGPFATQRVFRNRDVSLETQRGCVFRCAYCSYPKGLPQIQYVPLERLFEELEFLLKARTPRIAFVDATFHSDKSRAQSILEFCVKRNRGSVIELATRGDLLGKDELDLLVSAGVNHLDIGLQSSSPEVTRRVSRKNNLPKIKKGLAAIANSKINLSLGAIYGLPKGTREESIETVAFTMDLVDYWNYHLYLAHLSVLPGTGVRQYAGENDVVFSSWPSYEIISTDTMSAADMRECVFLAGFLQQGGAIFFRVLCKLLASRSGQSAGDHFKNVWNSLADSSGDLFTRRIFLPNVAYTQRPVSPQDQKTIREWLTSVVMQSLCSYFDSEEVPSLRRVPETN